MEDPSELFTETRDIGNINEYSLSDFQTSSWIYDRR